VASNPAQKKTAGGGRVQFIDNRPVSPVFQRLAFFAEQDGAAVATETAPLADTVWVTPLLGTNHALYPDEEDAADAVEANLGVVGEPTYSTVSADNEASNGNYEYWYDQDTTPTVLKGRPTHTSDSTNKLYRVTKNSITPYEPVVHKHAADYPDISSGNAWNVMANPATVYNRNAGAYDHYLQKPAAGGKTQVLKKKLAIKSEGSQPRKKMMRNYESIAKKGVVTWFD
jgi:hypothetical protein